ncbi:hypothetical protein D6783_00150 [Candidatus Woesearchaeota archaeon]|nr:MAG: hypothetical protein D6783_00150 [Candidatus Woesearchaeota archaeon]
MLRFKEDGTLDKERDILVLKTELEYENVFDLKELYKSLHFWLEEEGFQTDVDAQPASGGDLNFKEVLYWERVNEAGMTDHHAWWRVVRYPSGTTPKNAYHRLFFRINLQTIAMSKAEILHEKKKVKVDKGDVIVRLEAWLQIDYRNEFQKHAFLKQIDWLFRKKIWRDQIEVLKEDARKTAYRLQQHIKEYLELVQPYPQARLFHPYKGYK